MAARETARALTPRPTARLSVHIEARSHVAARRRERVVTAFADAFGQVIDDTLNDHLLTIRGTDAGLDIDWEVAPRRDSPRLFDVTITIELWVSVATADELLATLEALLEAPGGEPDFWRRLLREQRIYGVIASAYTIKATVDGKSRADRRGRLYLV